MDSNEICEERRDYEGKEVAEAYDQMQPDYPGEVGTAILRCLRENTERRTSLKFMLDVGCGGGISTKLFADHFERILGIDISQSQIDFARKTITKSNVTFKVVNDNLFPLADNSTDLVFCGMSFHYLNAPVCFAECNRVLVDGGLLACLVFGPDILKSPKGEVICTFSEPDSKWKKLQWGYFTNCGTDENVRESLLSRYEDAFSLIKNPTKRRIGVAGIDLKFTVAEFMKLTSTIVGYSRRSYPNPKLDPLNIFRDGLAEIFQDAGLKCNDDTEFIATFNYSAMVVEKTKEYGIS